MSPRSLLLLLALLIGLTAAATAAGAATAPRQHRAELAQCKITQNHSLVGSKRTSLRFVNKTRQPVRVDWLDYTGVRVFYAKLAAGAAYTQSTWFTHPWVVLNPAGRCIGYVIAGKTRTYVIR